MATPQNPGETPIPVYFDCDTGIDDALALAMLLAHPQAYLLGVGTVSGNVDAAQAATNTLRLLALAGREDIPVAVGEMHPLAGTFPGGATDVHGANGIGDIELPDTDMKPAAESAPDMLIRLARAHRGRLHVIAVGPCTNLAVALDRAPDLPDLVAHVTVMGGAVDLPGNVTPAAEANIYSDPGAAARVFAAGWPITLAALDVTTQHLLSEDDRQRMLASTAPLTKALGAMLAQCFDFHERVLGFRGCSLHDPLAVGLALGMVRVADASQATMTVDTSTGPDRGATRRIPNSKNGPNSIDITARTTVVAATDRPLAPELLALITGDSHPTETPGA
jgi:purine nucleosidase